MATKGLNSSHNEVQIITDYIIFNFPLIDQMILYTSVTFYQCPSPSNIISNNTPHSYMQTEGLYKCKADVTQQQDQFPSLLPSA